MTLTDTGPLIALINQTDPHHNTCLAASKRLASGPLLTTWPCFTEAMYLLYQAGGYPAQVALWQLWAGGRLALHDLSTAEVHGMVALMAAYRDTPMDLADASRIMTAETLPLSRIFTLDSDFYVYRLANGTALEVVP